MSGGMARLRRRHPKASLAAVVFGVVVAVGGLAVVGFFLVTFLGSSLSSLDDAGAFPGRLVLAQNDDVSLGHSGLAAVLQVTSDDRSPEPLITLPPGASVHGASPDGHLVVVSPGLLIDLSTGQTAPLPVPQGPVDGVRGVAVFSPSGNRLAYAHTVRGIADGPISGLYVIDLATRRTTAVLPVECASYYSTTGGGGSEVCGQVGRPSWVDDDTLAFSYLRGGLPGNLEGYGDTVGSDTIAVLRSDGSVLQEIETTDDVLGVAGGVALVEGEDPASFEFTDGWLPVEDLLAGRYELRQVDHPAHLAPDGRILMAGESTWRLFDPRTGTETEPDGGVRTGDGPRECIWSTDGTYAACSIYTGGAPALVLIPMAEQGGGGRVTTFESDAYPSPVPIAWTPEGGPTPVGVTIPG